MGPILQEIVTLLGHIPGEVASHVDLVALETTVAAAIAGGGGLPEVLLAVIADAPKIFKTSRYAALAVSLLTVSSNLLKLHSASPNA